jgi:hypothetical protein
MKGKIYPTARFAFLTGTWAEYPIALLMLSAPRHVASSRSSTAQQGNDCVI